MAIAPLSFKITADLSGFNSALGQVTGRLRGVVDQVRSSFQGVTQQTTASMGAASTGVSGLAAKLGGLAAIYAGLRSFQAFARIADEASLATARIEGLTGSTEQTRQAQGALFEMSQRLQAGYGEAVSSFSRMLPAVKELGGGVKETTGLTEILLTTAKLSGASAAEASASAMQFAQALGSGKLQGDELRSILENNNTLARTLAEGLGVSIGELRRMGEEGKLTSDLVANTLLSSYDDIKARAANLPATVGGAWTEIKNAFTLFVTSVSNGTGIFGALAETLGEIAKVIVIVARSFGGAGTEADRLAQNQSAQNFAEAVGSAFARLADIVRAVISSVVDLVRAFVDVFRAAGDSIGAVAAATMAALRGDFSGAAAIMEEAGARGATAVQRLGTAIGESAAKVKLALTGEGDAYRAYIDGLSKAADEASGGGGTLQGGGGGEEKGKTNDRAFIAQMNAEAEAIEKTIEAERRRFAVAQEVAQTRADMDRDRALAAIDAEQRVARFQLDTQQLTQQQYLAAELVFEEQRYEIRRQAAERTLELAKAEGRDPAEVERINAQLLALELDFQARKQEIALEVQKGAQGGGGVGEVAGGAFRSMQQSMGQALDSMLTRAKSFGQAMAGIWGNMRSAILSEISKILLAKVAAFAKEKLLALAGITMHAAKAGAGAAESQAAIPVVGPGLALAAMAAISAAVLGLSGGIKSARGGFDIPSGLNPVTQLHAEEMVLPAEQAQVIRELARANASSPPIELRGVSAGEFFIAVRRDLVDALKSARREFEF